jgi:hypothetical protein
MNLPFNTYIIHAEMMGIHTTQAEITLSEQNPSSSVEVQVSGSEANFVFGLAEQKINLEKVGDIFPNPVSGNAQLEITARETTNLQVRIFNQNGQLMNAGNLSLSSGTYNYKLETETLPAGLYLLRITSDQGDMVCRKFMRVQ